jgi:hypothetical protein
MDCSLPVNDCGDEHHFGARSFQPDRTTPMRSCRRRADPADIHTLKADLWMEQPIHNAFSHKFKFSFRNGELLMPAHYDRADAAGRKNPG